MTKPKEVDRSSELIEKIMDVMGSCRPMDLSSKSMEKLIDIVASYQPKGRGGKPKGKTRRFPESVGSLGLAQIQQIVCSLECSGETRSETRKLLAQRFEVPANTIDWCSANRTMALRNTKDAKTATWPFHVDLSPPTRNDE